MPSSNRLVVAHVAHQVVKTLTVTRKDTEKRGGEASDTDQVQRLYDIALAHGGSDEGAPGPRGEGFYAGYFRDPDGNKLNAFVMG